MLGPAFVLRPGPSLFPGPCHRLPTPAQMPGPLQNPASHRPLPTDSILFMPNPLPESRLLRLKFPNAATILQVCPPEASNMVGCFTPWHYCDLVLEPLVLPAACHHHRRCHRKTMVTGGFCAPIPPPAADWSSPSSLDPASWSSSKSWPPSILPSFNHTQSRKDRV